MKILEAQSATLTNYEVYAHVVDQKARYAARAPKRRLGPGNLETLIKELLDYLRAAPSPLGCKPLQYNSSTIKNLVERLRPYDLSKAEMLMIMNHRPTSVNALTYIVEELELRYPDPEVQEEMLTIIAEFLGTPDEAAERKAMEDRKEAEGRAGRLGGQIAADASSSGNV